MNYIIIPVFLLIIIYGVYNASNLASNSKESKKQTETTNTNYAKHQEQHNKNHYEDELSRLNSVEYNKNYIISVINHGSYDLDFVGGVMEGGFASKEDAPKIACHVLTLSGKQCKAPYPQDAQMFYTSICGGCHGDDGKGLGGNYPDLTKNKLLGIEKREIFLRSMVGKE